LNNPAAAAQRGAAQLQAAVSHLQQSHLKLGELDLDEGQMATLLDLDELARQRARQPTDLDALARSDREAELEAWLDEQGVQEAWRVAPTLVNLDFDYRALRSLVASFTTAQFCTVIDWLCDTHTIYSLLEEIGQGAGRISEIVKALKGYAYLDQAPVQAVDVHAGLDSTLVILRSKLKAGVVVRRDYAPDLPTIQAYGSELNQVWTNLIDNAIGALNGAGQITLRTRHDDEWLIVEIEDNGPGIPDEVVPHLFEPFFTTKPPGEGTGLGLNISHNIVVQKHQGRIDVHSRPGLTRFEVRLPLAGTPGQA
jgi:signal transduction histidine kinase